MKKDEILERIKNEPEILQTIDKELFYDKYFMYDILDESILLFSFYVDKKLLEDETYVKKILLKNFDTSLLLTKDTKNNVLKDRQLIYELLKKNPFSVYPKLPLNIRDDRSLIIQFVKSDFFYDFPYEHIPKKLLNDKEFISFLLPNAKEKLFKYLSSEFRADESLIDCFFDKTVLSNEDIEELYIRNGQMCINWHNFDNKEFMSIISLITNKIFINELVKEYPIAYLWLSENHLLDDDLLTFISSDTLMQEFLPYYQYWYLLEEKLTKLNLIQNYNY